MRELDELLKLFGPSGSQASESGRLLSDRRLSTGFNLEHGAAELAQWFSSVTLHRYEDALIVPDAEPLVAYVQSTGSLTADRLARFRGHVEARIQRDGPIRIGKDGGMFEAHRPDAG